jgi:NAD+--asparagine ADP-ribosyltransferase
LLTNLPKGIEHAPDVSYEPEQKMASSDNINNSSSEKVNKIVAGDFRIDLDQVSSLDLKLIRKLIPTDKYKSLKRSKDARIVRLRKKLTAKDFEHKYEELKLENEELKLTISKHNKMFTELKG